LTDWSDAFVCPEKRERDTMPLKELGETLQVLCPRANVFKVRGVHIVEIDPADDRSTPLRDMA
jgi:hypothetical protein